MMLGINTYTAQISMQVLRKMFPGRIISHFADITWPTHSSDLAVSYCYLWGYIKSKVNETCPAKPCDLKLQICKCNQGIPKEILQYTGLFISPSGISELDCATTKTDTAERSISIGRESLQVFFGTRGLGVLPGSTARGSREEKWRSQ